MATSVGQCPHCYAANSYSAVNCISCGKRLPWGDAVQSAQQQIDDAQKQASAAQAAAAQVQNNTPSATLKVCPQCQSVYQRPFPTYCSKCGSLLTAPPSNAPLANYDDDPSFGSWILGFLLPIGGLIIWAYQKDSYPQRSISALRGALWGLLIGVMLGGGYYTYRPDIPFVHNPFYTPQTPEEVVTTSHDKGYYETMVKDGLNEKYQQKGLNITCVSVSLVHEANNKYSGFAELSDDTKLDVTVTIDEDGEMIWKAL